MATLPGGNEGALNGTTPVVIVAAPALATQRTIKDISFHNRDTATVQVTLRKIKGASTFELTRVDINSRSTYVWDKVVVLDATDESVTAVMSAAPATNQPDFDASYLETT